MTCITQASGCPAYSPTTPCPGTLVCAVGTLGADCCSNDCTLGDTKCTGNVPASCVKTVAGCASWVNSAACVSPQACAQGACRNPCTTGEIGTCDPGYACVYVPDPVCVPTAKDGGVGPVSGDGGSTIVTGSDGGSIIVSKGDAGANTNRDGGASVLPSEGASGSCGCAAGAAPAGLALLPLLIAFWPRRRRSA
jgi:MYXO-CTERM domain-containing protein